MVILGVGLVLLGVTSLRSKTPHRWRGLPLGLGLLSTMFGTIGWLVVYVPLSQGRPPWDSLNPWNPWNPQNFGIYLLLPAVDLLLGVGWMVLGSTLAAEANSEVTPSPPASA